MRRAGCRATVAAHPDGHQRDDQREDGGRRADGQRRLNPGGRRGGRWGCPAGRRARRWRNARLRCGDRAPDVVVDDGPGHAAGARRSPILDGPRVDRRNTPIAAQNGGYLRSRRWPVTNPGSGSRRARCRVTGTALRAELGGRAGAVIWRAGGRGCPARDGLCKKRNWDTRGAGAPGRAGRGHVETGLAWRRCQAGRCNRAATAPVMLGGRADAAAGRIGSGGGTDVAMRRRGRSPGAAAADGPLPLLGGDPGTASAGRLRAERGSGHAARRASGYCRGAGGPARLPRTR